MGRAGLRHTQAIGGGPEIRGARGEGSRTTCCSRRSRDSRKRVSPGPVVGFLGGLQGCLSGKDEMCTFIPIRAALHLTGAQRGQDPPAARSERAALGQSGLASALCTPGTIMDG